MRRISYLLLAALTGLAVAACGDDDGGDGNIDAGVDAPDIDAPPAASCGTPVTTISAYPATYEGTVLGAGNDLSVAEGACADERGYFGSSGEDHVIALTGLTAGSTYIMTLETGEDIMMYVTSGCTGGEPTTGSCLLLVDQTIGNEAGEFVAPAGGSVELIIDTPDDVSLTDGAYTLSIREGECQDDNQCTNPNAPICSNFTCVQCTTNFDCTAEATPVCDATNTCVAGPAMCTGDDANEPDDGPAAANPLTFPTAGNPTTTDAAVCNVPGTEGDWYRFTATAAGDLRVQATWTAAMTDLDFYIYDATGALIELGISTAPTSETVLMAVPAAGDYLIEVVMYDPADSMAAAMYTLSLALPECSSSFDCEVAGMPVCDGGLCVAGPSMCTGDDPVDADDGPAAARPIVAPVIGVAVPSTRSVCNAPAVEADWFSIAVGAGEGLTANLSWTGTAASPDLDVFIYDTEGNLLGTSFWLLPEVVTLTYLPAGTYYLSVSRAGAAVPAAVAYTLEVTRTTAQTCQSVADCASEYQTQLFRGNCTGGTCQLIPAGMAANGTICDSFDDCMSGECSYIPFESDAEDSRCTTSCTQTSDCAALGAGFTCTTGFQTNICVPQCANDQECGANVNSSAIDTGLPWNYFTCALPAGTCGP